MERENNEPENVNIREKIKENLDLIIASGGVLLGIFIIYMSIAFGIHQKDIGGTVLIASVLYILLRKRLLKASETFEFKPSRKFIYFNNIIFFLALSLSVWLLYTTLYSRPLIYFVLVAVACASIALEILYSNNKKWVGLILIKILLIGIILHGGLYYEFDGVYGVDSKYHNNMVAKTIAENHIPSGELYSDFPIFYLLSSSTSILTSLNVYNSIFSSMTFLFVFSVVFVFLIGQKLINTNAGLLAALMLVVGDQRSFFGAAPVPMSLGLVFFTIILYLFIVNTPKPLYKRIIAFFLLVILILTHTIAGFVMFIVLLSLLTWKNINKHLNNISAGKFTLLWSTTIAFGVMLLEYWTHAFQRPGGESFFDERLRGLYIGLTQDAEFAVGAAEKVSYYLPISGFEIFLDHLGYLIFLVIGIIGTYIWIKDKDEFKFPLCLSMVVLFIILYGFSLFGINALLQTRWFVFVYVILALVSAFGLFKLANLINKKFGEIAVVTFMFLLSLIMITSPAGITILHPEEERSAMTSKTSELLWDVTIHQIFNGTYGLLSPDIASFDYNYSKDGGKLYALMKDAFKYPLVRTEAEIKGGQEVKRNTRFILGNELKIGLESNSNEIYNNGEVWGYVIKENC